MKITGFPTIEAARESRKRPQYLPGELSARKKFLLNAMNTRDWYTTALLLDHPEFFAGFNELTNSTKLDRKNAQSRLMADLRSLEKLGKVVIERGIGATDACTFKKVKEPKE